MGRQADIVERIMVLGHQRLAESLDLLHPEAEWIPDVAHAPIRGRDQIADHVRREVARLGALVPEAVPMTLTEHEDAVVVCGQLKVPRALGEGSFTELQPVAWAYELSGELVSRVTLFRSWDEAFRAAGITPGTPPTRKLSPGWRFAVSRALTQLRGPVSPARLSAQATL